MIRYAKTLVLLAIGVVAVHCLRSATRREPPLTRREPPLTDEEFQVVHRLVAIESMRSRYLPSPEEFEVIWRRAEDAARRSGAGSMPPR